MFEMILSMSEDRAEATISLPGMTEPLKMTATEMDDFIRHLTWHRASMRPAHEAADPKTDTQVSVVPAIRWYVTEDALPSQCRLFLLHPGFGWSGIPLDAASFEKLARTARRILRRRPSIQ